MILITGAAGFIGSCLVQYLNELGRSDLVLVDDFKRKSPSSNFPDSYRDGRTSALKSKNYQSKKYQKLVHRDQLFDWLKIHGDTIKFVFHLGARTDTTEKNRRIFDELNLSYSKKIWNFCSEKAIPMVYASSAATYGLGTLGYEDSHSIIQALRPLNPYGDSKNDFDIWALKQPIQPPQWQGLKFFNVYGPNEYHKGRMASVVFHTFNQIQQTGGMKLFRSHRADFADGEQSRDFIYVKDVVKVCTFFMQHPVENGLFNVGTGIARPFWDLAANTFKALNLPVNISFIDTPIDIRETYQYFTKANMNKLRKVGYDAPFYNLEEGVIEYVTTYLKQKCYY